MFRIWLILFLLFPQAYPTDLDLSEFPLPEEALPVSFLEPQGAIPIGNDMAVDGLFGDALYQAEFTLMDRSLIGRAEGEIIFLQNNSPRKVSISSGGSQHFMFHLLQDKRRDAVALDKSEPDSIQRRKSESQFVYISANVCERPQPGSQSVKEPAPPPKLYVSTSGNNQMPGPVDMTDTTAINFVEGYSVYRAATDDIDAVYFGVVTPSSSDHRGSWSVEIAVSIDKVFHEVNNASEASLVWIDSDSHSAIIVTDSILSNTQSDRTRKGDPTYALFVDRKDSLRTQGLRHSYCGLETYAPFSLGKTQEDGGLPIRTNVTFRLLYSQRGDSPAVPKQQFHVSSLDSNTEYEAVLVKRPVAGDGSEPRKRDESLSEVPNGGGMVMASILSFSTKQSDNCQILANLDFCNDTDYAVPSNANKKNATELRDFYDNYARSVYENFEKALAQVPCEAPPSSMYSLARNCDDCREAYKKWLCVVAIPRCNDHSAEDSVLQARNILQPFPNGTTLPDSVIKPLAEDPAALSSRNVRIDTELEPGPYKELLPCIDLCYEIVRSCPAALGFGCPTPKDPLFNKSYAVRDINKTLSCNYPGAAHQKAGTSSLWYGSGWSIMSSAVVGILCWMI